MQSSRDLFIVRQSGLETAKTYNTYIEQNYSGLPSVQQTELLKTIESEMISLNRQAYAAIAVVIGNNAEFHDMLQRIHSRILLNHLVIPRVIFFGATGLLAAIEFTGLGKILLTDEANGAGATSLIAPIIAAIATMTLNAISVGGIQLSKAIDKTDRINIIRLTRIMAILLGVGFGSILLLAQLILPHMVKNGATAKITGDFLAAYATSIVPDLLLAINGIVAFQNDKSWLMPPITAAIYRLLALALAFALGKNFQAYGVGFGASIAALVGMLISQLWFCQAKYDNTQLWSLLSTADLKIRIKEFRKKAAELGLGGLTEWGNLAVITFIIGAFTHKLGEVQPAIATLVLVNSFFQGLSRASMFVTSENTYNLDQAIVRVNSIDFHKSNLVRLDLLPEATNLDASITKNTIDIQLLSKYPFYNQENFDALADECSVKEFLNTLNYPLGELINLDIAYSENKTYIYKNILAAIILSCTIVGIIYATKRSIIDYFSPVGLDDKSKNLAETLLLINIIGLIPDSIRIALASTLRGYDNLLAPNIISLVLMSMIGIPVGAAIGLSKENIIPLFIARNITISAAAIVSAYMLWQQFSIKHRTPYQALRIKLTRL